MVKTPRTKHSKSSKEPVTIELEAGDVAESDAGDKTNEPAEDNTSTDSDAASAEQETVSEETLASGENAGEENAADRKEKPRRGSAAGLVMAGLIGGVIALGGGAALNMSGILSAGDVPDKADVVALREELTVLKSDLQSGLGSAAENTRTAVSEAIDAARVEYDAKIAYVASSVGALETSLAELQSAIERGQGGDSAGLQVLKDRLDGLEQKLAELTDAPGTDVSGQTLEALRAALDDVRGGVSQATELATTAKESVAANTAVIGEMKAELTNLAARVEQAGSNPEVALAIAAAALKSAIDRGLPFMSELETYAALAPDAPEIEALRNLAASGVPTRSDIATGMADAAGAMVAAARAIDPDAGFFERLIASAQSLIKVRPIGMVEGDSPAAIVARMEVAVNENDLAGAVAEYQTLPEAAKEAGKAFVDGIEARIEADRLVESALAAALKPAAG